MELETVGRVALTFLGELQAFARERTDPLPRGGMLHDDGDTMWLVDQEGMRETLLTHTAIEVGSLAISGDGTRLALGVWLNPEDRDEVASATYEVILGNGAELIDAVDSFGGVGSPTFLRPPSTLPAGFDHAEEELYWIRFWEELDPDSGRWRTQVVRWSKGERSIVEVPLRHGEAVNGIDGYAGGHWLTVSLVRRSGGDPTTYEVLVNKDPAGVEGASLDTWSIFVTRGNTEANLNVAWLAPGRFAVPMHTQHEDHVSFNIWRVFCGHRGPVSVGPFDLDWGYHSWSVLALDEGRLLVLRRADLEAYEETGASVHWHVIDTETSTPTATPTAIRWEPGAWAVVREPPTEVEWPDDC